MKKNLFEMSTDFSDDWTSDNKVKSVNAIVSDIKTPQKHQLHFAKEKRRGKVVTLVKPFHLEYADLQSLLKIIKKKLATGGTIKDNTLEFQGEVQEQLKGILESLEYRFKH